jgi:hypothetical protein
MDDLRLPRTTCSTNPKQTHRDGEIAEKAGTEVDRPESQQWNLEEICDRL